MAEGEFAQVREHLEQALRRPVLSPSEVDPAADHDLYAMLADVAGRQRDRSALQKYALRAEELAHLCNHNLYIAIANRAQGILHRLNGDLPAASEQLKKALERFQSLGTRWQIALTFFEMGELAVEGVDTSEAEQRYREAVQLFEAQGAAPHADQVRTALRALRGPD